MIELPTSSVLVFSLDPAIRDVLRWATGEIVEHVHVATTWTGAATMASTYKPALAVVDVDGLAANVRDSLLKTLTARLEIPIVAVGNHAAATEAQTLGLDTWLEKPINVGALMDHVQRLAERRGHS